MHIIRHYRIVWIVSFLLILLAMSRFSLSFPILNQYKQLMFRRTIHNYPTGFTNYLLVRYASSKIPLSASRSSRIMSKKQVAREASDKKLSPPSFIPISSISTEDTVSLNLKEYQKTKSAKKMLKMLEDAGSCNLLSLNITREALKTLQIMNETEHGPQIFKLYLSTNNQSSTMDLVTQTSNTAFLVKWFCKNHNMDVVESIFDKINLVLIPGNVTESIISLTEKHVENSSQEVKEYYKLYYADLLIQATLGFAVDKSFKKSLLCLETMAHHNMSIDLESSRKILKLFTKESNTMQSLEAMRLLLDVDGIYDQDSLQIAVNSFGRNIEFIKGAVSMDTLPEERYGEVAFIGRSNVGKSSLINAVTNRKNLAYTSKTAGKTSEFNYFLISGSVGVKKEEPKFYLIDLPGVGYAQRSKSTRSTWTKLMEQFTKERSSLRCIFHLIDSRHGVMDADDECFQLLEGLPHHIKYAVIFTKVDKLRCSQSKLRNGNFVSPAILDNLVQKLQQYSSRQIPILYSSAETKFGAMSVLHTALHAVSDLAFPAVVVDQEDSKV